MEREFEPRTHAFLGIYRDDLDPLDITIALRVPPTLALRRGEPRLTVMGTGEIREYYAPRSGGVWGFDTERYVDSNKTDVHLRWLLRVLAGRETEMLRLTSEYNVYLTVYLNKKNVQHASSNIRQDFERMGIEIHYDKLFVYLGDEAE